MREGDYQLTSRDPTGYDWAVFAKRVEGWELRDTIYVSLAQGALFYGLMRRPQSDTVHSSIVRNGVGALDIDRCRIGSERRQATAGNRTVKWGVQEGGCSYEKGTGATYTNEGRFPANFLLVHTEQCLLKGTKRVKPSNGSGKAHQDNKHVANKVYQGEWNPKGVKGEAGYTGSDGLEEVSVWSCDLSCPVSLLKQQTLVSEDSGTAARFFFQGADTDQVATYLEQLIRG